MPEPVPAILSSAAPNGQCDPILDALVALVKDASQYAQGKLTQDQMMEAASAYILTVAEIHHPS